jgi:hypothetical protein
MTVNNIPCKLLYTEYSKSSRSTIHGYHITYIIALDYNIMNEHIKHRKLLIKFSRDEKIIIINIAQRNNINNKKIYYAYINETNQYYIDT